jgi:integrase
MAKRREPDWIRGDHADEYLMAAAHHLARAALRPVVTLLPPPSVSATLYCAFAAEAYVNVALARVLGEAEYEPLSRMPVRSKYFLAPWLLAFEDRFTAGEPVLASLDELFTARNRLVHAQPERIYYRPKDEEPGREPRIVPKLPDVAKWLAATADAVCRISRSYAELQEMERIAGPLTELEPLLLRFDPERDGAELNRRVKSLREQRIRDDQEDFLDEAEIDDLIAAEDPDWDLRGLPEEP